MANRADQRKYHYIYKITRADGSEKFYIGMHSTDDLEDGYLGSGQRLWKSINKHGKDKHSKEILEFLPTRKELRDREREIVNEKLLDNKLCMNLCLGGNGGFDTVNSKRQNIYGTNGQPGHGGQNLHFGRTSEANKIRWKFHRETYSRVIKTAQPLAVVAAQSKSANEKRAATFNAIGHQQGSSNSQFGTCWVTNGSKPVKITKDKLEEYLTNGYSRGRKGTVGIRRIGDALPSEGRCTGFDSLGPCHGESTPLLMETR